MNLLDVIFVLLLAFFCIKGFFRGMLREIAAILGLVVGFVLANTYYMQAAELVSPVLSDPGHARVAGYLIVVVGTMLAVWIGVRIFSGILRVGVLAWLDHALGGALGFVKGVLLCTVIVIALAAFMPESDLLAGSRLAPYIAKVADVLRGLMPEELVRTLDEGRRVLFQSIGYIPSQ